jgi:hypothetical protein
MAFASWSERVMTILTSETSSGRVDLDLVSTGISDPMQEEIPVAAFSAATHLSGPEAIARHRRRDYLVFTLCASLYLLPFVLILLQGTDEGTLIYGAVRIVHGQILGRDFFEVVGPGTFYWLALFFKLFGVTIMGVRVCLFLTSLGTALLMYFLSRKLCKKHQMLPCAILAGTYFGMLWPAISHHVDSNFFALASVASIVAWQDTHRKILLIAAGILAGATTCFLQPKGILLLLSLSLWLWIQYQRRCAHRSALGLVVGSYFGVMGIVFVYFWSRGALWDLVYANVVWPWGHYGAVNVVPYAQGIVRNYWNPWVMAKDGLHWTVVMASVLITPFLFVAALPGLLLILAGRLKWNFLRPEVALYWLCGSALWLSEFHRKDIFHLVFGSPLLIILCIHLLSERREKIADLALQVLSITAGSLACFNLFLVLTAHPVPTRVGSVALFKNDPVLTFLDDHVAPGEEIFAYPYCPMYYFLSATTNPTRFSILLSNYNTAAQIEEVIQVLEQRRVRYVVWDATFETNGTKSFFPGSESLRSGDIMVEPYLESHYRVVWADSGTRIMERNREDHGN